MPLPLSPTYVLLFLTLQALDIFFLISLNLISCLLVSVTLCYTSLSRSGEILVLFLNLIYKKKIQE